jgi:hypothetical protein
MPTVKMLRNEKGSPDGLAVQVYNKDQEYDLPDSLSDVFLKIGSAELVTDDIPDESIVEAKAEEGSPKNKAEMIVPSNKAEEPKTAKKKSFIRRKDR